LYQQLEKGAFVQMGHRKPSGIIRDGRIYRGKMALLQINLPMNRSVRSRQTKPGSRRLVLVCAVAFAVLLLLLRMLRFVHGRQ
jgi:hypothetical protein